MFGSEILEVAIAMAFIYLILSLIASSVNEFIAYMLERRARTLLQGINTLLNDPQHKGLARALYQHPLIKGLGDSISFIPPTDFALALLDVLAPASEKDAPPPADSNRFQEVWQAVYQHDDPAVRQMLLPLLEQAAARGEATITAAAKQLESWFNDAMGSVTARYKRNVQRVIATIAVGSVLVLNADTISLVNTLLTDSTTRAAVVAQAEAFAAQPLAGEGETATLDTSVQALQGELEALQVPFGWVFKIDNADPRALPPNVMGWILKLAGLLFTAAAVSLGAPFWFDLLGKLIAVRNTTQKDED